MTLPALPVVPAIDIARIEALVFRYPVKVPVRTSFGTMHDRPAVFVRVTDRDGTVGWGEAWCNFPSCGAEHRARLIDTVLAPMLHDRRVEGPAAAWQLLTERTAVLALQSGEPGPFAQAIAGIDLALWDLAARRAGLPLWRLLASAGGEAEGAGRRDGKVRVYASGLNPDQPERIAQRRQAQGYRAFKLKVGFGVDRDLANLRALRDVLGEATPLMADANQAWTLAEAQAMAPRLAPFNLVWLEEPLRADRPWREWQQLQASTPLPLAGGENVAGEAAFEAALAAGVFSVMQPDIAKWGGISGCWPVIQRARAAGVRYCPHYLGAGVGLMASAHLLVAAGGDGMLEIDANDNPLRTELSPALQRIDDGAADLGEAPGIGVQPDPAAIQAAIDAAAGRADA